MFAIFALIALLAGASWKWVCFWIILFLLIEITAFPFFESEGVI
jgi:hypothetical protein